MSVESEVVSPLHDSRTEVSALGEVLTIPAGDIVGFRVMRVKEPKLG